MQPLQSGFVSVLPFTGARGHCTLASSAETEPDRPPQFPPLKERPGEVTFGVPTCMEKAKMQKHSASTPKE
jgi:hypothetical protein